MTRTCLTCRHRDIDIVDDGAVMECHRYPPVIVPLDDDVLTRLFPQVDEGDWCSEWQPAKDQT